MKTLVIAPFSPYPPVFGGAIRLYHVVKMLSCLSEVTLLSYRSWSRNGDNIGDLRRYCQQIILVERPHRRPRDKVLYQLKSLVSPWTYQYYLHHSDRFQQALDDTLRQEQFDCLVMESSQMGYFRLTDDQALRVLDLQNVEYELLQRRAERERQLIKRVALALEAKKFERDELAICRQFDLVFTPSGREADQLQPLVTPTQVRALPNSIDTDYFGLRHKVPTGNEITFVGATHVDANRDGLIYFMEKIFPLIEAQIPDIHFTIVGGSPPPQIREYGQRPNVDVTGYVDDVRPYMEQAKALVVPLYVGSGTRLKILEGLSFGVPTVSTSIGSEGIDVQDGKHILLADTSQEFADKVIRVLADPALQARLRDNGRRLVEQEYSWQAVGKNLGPYLDAARQRREQRLKRTKA